MKCWNEISMISKNTIHLTRKFTKGIFKYRISRSGCQYNQKLSLMAPLSAIIVYLMFTKTVFITNCLQTFSYIFWFHNIYFQLSSILWFPIFIKAKIKECSSTRKTYIFGKQRPHVWPKFHADSDGTNGFWNFYDFVQNNPTTKFATFWANISV